MPHMYLTPPPNSLWHSAQDSGAQSGLPDLQAGTSQPHDQECPLANLWSVLCTNAKQKSTFSPQRPMSNPGSVLPQVQGSVPGHEEEPLCEDGDEACWSSHWPSPLPSPAGSGDAASRLLPRSMSTGYCWSLKVEQGSYCYSHIQPQFNSLDQKYKTHFILQMYKNMAESVIMILSLNDYIYKTDRYLPYMYIYIQNKILLMQYINVTVQFLQKLLQLSHCFTMFQTAQNNFTFNIKGMIITVQQ